MSLLDVRHLQVRHGPVVAVHDLSFAVDAGEILCLVGPNGGGKSSALLALAGALPGQATGSVRLDGAEILGWRPERVARAGLSLVPETRRAFGDLTVAENLEIGALRLPDAATRRHALRNAYERFPTLGRLRGRPAGRLSGGEQQQLVIARALLGRPRLLLLDEPSLGLAPTVVAEVYALVAELVRQDKVALILVEQNALTAVRLAQSCVVLRSGRVEMTGAGGDLARDEGFLRAYFGPAGEAHDGDPDRDAMAEPAQ